MLTLVCECVGTHCMHVIPGASGAGAYLSAADRCFDVMHSKTLLLLQQLLTRVVQAHCHCIADRVCFGGLLARVLPLLHASDLVSAGHG